MVAYVETLAGMKTYEDYLAEKKRIADQAKDNIQAEMRRS